MISEKEHQLSRHSWLIEATLEKWKLYQEILLQFYLTKVVILYFVC